MKRKYFRLLLSAVLMMCCTVMANAQSFITIPIYEGKQPAVGDGSKENPYQIADYDNLCWFSWIVAHGQPSACAELIADITADGEHNWYPIGPGYRDGSIRYAGEFNGNGHTVTGLTHYFPHYNCENYTYHGGFFGCMENAKIHDVGIVDCNFLSYHDTGALCSLCHDSEIYNCWTTGTVLSVMSGSSGLVGSFNNGSKLKNCFTACKVKSDDYNEDNGVIFGGGMGRYKGEGTVENCYAQLPESDEYCKVLYHLHASCPPTITNVEAKPASAFSSGEVCWILNGGVTNGSQTWYQTIGTDNWPTLSKSSKTVSRCRATCTSNDYVYNNVNVNTDFRHALIHHPKVSCVASGYDKDYWECISCHTLFSDRECTQEINLSDLEYIQTSVTKDPEWVFADKFEVDGKTFNSACYVNVTLDDNDAKQTITNLSFSAPKDYDNFSMDFYFHQLGTMTGHLYPDADVIIKYYVNDELKKQNDYCEYKFLQLEAKEIIHSELIQLGAVRKDDIVKIEINLTNNTGVFAQDRPILIIHSIPDIGHVFSKHVNATCQHREYWECERCHNLFTSDAHLGSDEDITSLSNLDWDNDDYHSYQNDVCMHCGYNIEDGYYEIDNAEKLYWLARQVNVEGNTTIKARLTADITVNNNVLDQDDNLNDASSFLVWTPIGNDEHSFTGEFDGNGHTISGLYVNDANKNDVALFGRTFYPAYIHDLGVTDSYFCGSSWVAGICGDFAGGRIENCWNGATVIGKYILPCAGGIAASCWTDASMDGCYNIGKVSVESEVGAKDQCGGICGTVAKNPNVEYSVSNCISLYGKCDVACNLYSDASGTYNGAIIDNVYIMDASAFASGEVCWELNGNKIDTKWRQQIGKDLYPVWTGNYLVNHSEEKEYYNETMCEKADNHTHDFEKRDVAKCDDSVFTYWHCSACGKDFTDADRTKEETDANKSSHFPEHVMCIVPTSTKEGCYGYYKCTKCSGKFKDEPCNQPWANDNDLIVPKAKDNEIWYATTDGQQIAHGVSYKTNEYQYGLGKIVLADGVTEIADDAFKGKTTLMSMYIPSSVKKIGKYSFLGCTFLQSVLLSSGLEVIDDNAFDACTGLTSITIPETVTRIGKAVFVVSGSVNTSLQTVTIPENSQLEIIDDNAFNRCMALQSIRIPSSVRKIGNSSFWNCDAMESVIFSSLPNVDQYAFGNCGKLTTKVLYLKDGEKPYIGTSLNNYPSGGFTEARYHRTLEKDKWGTIVLPFKPASTEGLKFYALQSMTTGGEEGGSLTFMKVDAPDAGIPYLFRNEGESADFTLTAETPSSIELKTKEVVTTYFTMKGSFQQNQLDGAQNGNLYYLKDNEFYHANGKINIAPFRAYIEGSGATLAKSFMLVISDNGDDVTAIPGILDENGSIDETEAIYDLNGRRLAAPVKGQVNVIRTKSGKTIKRMF